MVLAKRFHSLVLDTDFGTYCDDAFAVYCLLQWQRQRCVNLQAIISTSRVNYAAAGIEAFCSYFGKPDIAVGAYQGNVAGVPSSDVYGTEVSALLSNRTGRTSHTESTTLYRTVLHEARDASLSLVVLGTCTSLKLLLLSSGDGIDERNGADLLSAKVAKLCIMGGEYPSGSEGNFTRDPDSANYVFANCPIPIISVGDSCGRIVSGTDIPDYLSQITNPLGIAYYEVHGTSHVGHYSWDVMALLATVFPTIENFNYGGSNGTNTVNASTGANSWAAIPAFGHSYLTHKFDDAVYAAIFDDLMYREPI